MPCFHNTRLMSHETIARFVFFAIAGSVVDVGDNNQDILVAILRGFVAILRILMKIFVTRIFLMLPRIYV